MMVTSPWVFFGIGGLLLAYVLYMMVRGRRARPGEVPEREAEL
jgi:hypothetical protein